MKKAITAGSVMVNDQVAQTATWVKSGDRIALFAQGISRPIYNHPISVVYEDDFIAIIDKPAGMVTNGNSHQTVEKALPHNLKTSTASAALPYPQVAHRLDFGTSGLLVIGKTMPALIACKTLFEDRLIKKTYRAITVGEMPKTGSIDLSIDEKPALTTYEIVKSKESKKYGQFNLVQLYPTTGRKHQIRKHLASIGHPILGDRDYGTEELWQMRRGLYLQASGIAFTHPILQTPIDINLPIPGKFNKLLKDH